MKTCYYLAIIVIFLFLPSKSNAQYPKGIKFYTGLQYKNIDEIDAVLSNTGWTLISSQEYYKPTNRHDFNPDYVLGYRNRVTYQKKNTIHTTKELSIKIKKDNNSNNVILTLHNRAVFNNLIMQIRETGFHLKIPPYTFYDTNHENSLIGDKIRIKSVTRSYVKGNINITASVNYMGIVTSAKYKNATGNSYFNYRNTENNYSIDIFQ